MYGLGPLHPNLGKCNVSINIVLNLNINDQHLVYSGKDNKFALLRSKMFFKSIKINFKMCLGANTLRFRVKQTLWMLIMAD